MSIHIKSRAAWAAVSLAAVAAVSSLASAQTTPADSNAAAPGLSAAPTPPTIDLTKVTPDEAKQYLKTFGYLMAQRMGVKQLNLTADDIDQFASGMKQLLAANLTDDVPGGKDMVLKTQAYLEARADAAAKEEVVKQKAVSDKFFADLDKNPNVKKTSTGLYYQIVTPGDDKKPTDTDLLTVKYKGTLIDGTVFDQTVDTDPTKSTQKFTLGDVIPGWREGMKLIGKGGKIKLYIPANLAYGDEPAGPIPAGSTLLFDVSIEDIQAMPDLSSLMNSGGGPGGIQLTPAPATGSGSAK